MRMLRFGTSLLLLVAVANAHSNHRHACVEATAPMEKFDPTRFLGDWYVTKSFDPDVTCYKLNYASCGEKCLKVKETKQINAIDTLGLTNVYQTDGTLKVEGDNPADMRASFRTNPRSALYTVLATDYSNFAAVFTCQNVGTDALPLYHRRDVYVLVRDLNTPLTPEQVEQVSAAMEANMIEDEFRNVTHKDCMSPDDATLDLDISKFGERVRDAADKVATGFKKFASSIAGLFSSSDDKEPASEGVTPLQVEATVEDVSPLRRRRNAHF